MHHSTPLIATVVIGLGVAFLLGVITSRLRISPIVGYLAAGVLIGPHTPGFVGDQKLASELAELGIILLMFGVGLHFSLKDLLSVRSIAIPGALVQIAVATAMGAGLGWFLGWKPGASFVFGLALSVASTVVLIRALQERHVMKTERGRIAVGWLIVEDLAMVLALVLLPALASVLGTNAAASGSTPFHLDSGVWAALALTVLKIAGFITLMLVVGRQLVPWILHYVAHTGSRELFRLAVLAIALGVAFGAARLFEVSFALGAFFAGMVMCESPLSQRAAEETLPLRDAFAVLFFVSVGMLFDPTSIIRTPLPILATVFIIVIGKSVAAFLIVLAFRHPVRTALMISASLAQIGEFSFILAELGVETNLLPTEARDLILSGAILSIMINPLAFNAISRIKIRFNMHGAATPEAERPRAAPTPDIGRTVDEIHSPTTLTNHTILVGYGRVGTLVGRALREADIPFLVIEDTDRTIVSSRKDGVEGIAGNAAHPRTLRAANIASARRLILTIPNAFEAGQIVQQARAASPEITIIARAHLDAEVKHVTELGADIVVADAEESARSIIRHVLTASGGPIP